MFYEDFLYFEITILFSKKNIGKKDKLNFV